MFTKKVTDDDNFMALSSSAQALYLHLSMSADDDGFCNQVSISMFKAHASVQDLQALLEKRYIYQFENGVIVIKHWRMANALRKDRYTPTAFKEELAQLEIKENGSYTRLPLGCQVVAEGLPQVSIGKDSIGQVSLVEGSVENGTTATAEENKLKCLKGNLGKGVVYLTDKQFDKLLDLLGMDAFDRYVGRLADFIIDKKAHVKNHFEMILKWWKEDSGVTE
jgi:hypothetical protein